MSNNIILNIITHVFIFWKGRYLVKIQFEKVFLSPNKKKDGSALWWVKYCCLLVCFLVVLAYFFVCLNTLIPFQWSCGFWQVSSHSQGPLTPMGLYFSKNITVFAAGAYMADILDYYSNSNMGCVCMCVCTILHIKHDGFMVC